jgi:CheY-like chemotaxis protein
MKRMAPHTPGSIVVSDDELRLVRVLARVLQRDGSVVETASNGRHARAALQTPRYDMMLCDLRMSERDGRAFYARLRQQAPALCQRVISLTRASSAADHQAFLGVTHHTYHGASQEAPSVSERSLNDAETLRGLRAPGQCAFIYRSALQGRRSHEVDDGPGAGVDHRRGTAGQLCDSACLTRG